MSKKSETGIGDLAAIAALGSGGELDPALKALLMEELQERIQARKDEKEQHLAWRKANAEALNEARKAQKAERALCLHRKINGETALAGQHIGNGQLCFTCLKCNDEFHKPPQGSQKEPPMHLIPTQGVGGPAFS